MPTPFRMPDLVRVFLAEFIGTFVLVVSSLSSIPFASPFLSENEEFYTRTGLQERLKVFRNF